MVGKQMIKGDDLPKDLGIKIGTKEEKKWTELRNKEKENLLSHKMNVEITEVMIIHAEKRIAEEQKKMKK